MNGIVFLYVMKGNAADMLTNDKIRNIAIVAHVDHGKTTLVDKLLRHNGCFRVNQNMPDRIMDSNDLERERGITILSKNTSIRYGETKINIIDTPGHADFGGEVERIVNMVDGVLLLVDAFEGPMPQTRFVLQKALDAGLKPLVVINKIDRPDARPFEVIDKVLDLFIDLGANEEQLDFPIIYASAKWGMAKDSLESSSDNMVPLLDAILAKIPSPAGDPDQPLQIAVSSIDYDNYVGRVGIGKIARGTIHKGQELILCDLQGKQAKVKISSLNIFEGLNRVEAEAAAAGEIIAISGIEDLNIGDTLCSAEKIEPVSFARIDQPTISMNFIVNDSPMAGREGSYVTSRHLKERLQRELLSNVSLLIEELSPDSFKVSGRGELHLSILIETMRREGYEFAVTRPEVILRDVNDVIHEPMEKLFIEVPEEYMGTVIEYTSRRKGEMVNIDNSGTNTVKIEFSIPARGLIGYRSGFLTQTRGAGLMNHIFAGYEPFKGDISGRTRGALVASEAGSAVAYGLYNSQERGVLFIGPGTEVYEGMIVGENARSGDITVNVCKRKQLTNTRASGSDDALRLVPPLVLSLESLLEFLADDELLEATPQSLRLRKTILDKTSRERASRNKNRVS
jgi:GTP-binding protein